MGPWVAFPLSLGNKRALPSERRDTNDDEQGLRSRVEFGAVQRLECCLDKRPEAVESCSFPEEISAGVALKLHADPAVLDAGRCRSCNAADIVALVRRVDQLQQALAESENQRNLLQAQVNQQQVVENQLHTQVEALRTGKRRVKYNIGITASNADEATLMLTRLQRE